MTLALALASHHKHWGDAGINLTYIPALRHQRQTNQIFRKKVNIRNTIQIVKAIFFQFK